MITKKQWLKLVSKVEQTFEDEFKAEYNSPELMYPLVKRLLQQTPCKAKFICPVCKSTKFDGHDCDDCSFDADSM